MIRTQTVPIGSLAKGDRIVWRGFVLPVERVTRNTGFPFPVVVSWFTVQFSRVAWGAPCEVVYSDVDAVERVHPRRSVPKCVRCAGAAVATRDGFEFCMNCFTRAIQNGDNATAEAQS